MATAFLSSDWYRVADLRLRRHSHVRSVRHIYRGDIWHVLQDPQSGKTHRLTEAGFAFFSRLDGQRSVQEIWLRCCALFPEHPPSQTEILQLLAQLHSGDLILGDRLPNLPEVDRRAREEERKLFLSYVKNPLSIRIPLVDPERFLKKTEIIGHVLFSPFGAALWLCVVLSALVTFALNWQAWQFPVFEQTATAANLAYLAIAYGLVKLIHELGHGYAVKRWGGEVREFGVMMLVFFPVPYVDASQATFFQSKYQRMIVSAAGILVELAVAAIAFFVWLYAEPGPIKTLAYNLVLIGSVSTLFFNGNPLLRFDGYFVFADYFESPNLGQRSNQYFWHLFRKVILGDGESRPPVVGHREHWLLFGYAVAAFLYRMFILFFIAIYLALALPVIGIGLVIWSLYTVIIAPAAKGLKYLMRDPSIDLIRWAVWRRLFLFMGVIFAFLFLVPVPHVISTDAVLEPPEGSLVRVQGRGFVSSVLVEDGQPVSAGDAVMLLSDPFLSLERTLADAERADAVDRLSALPIFEGNARQLWMEQVRYADVRLADFTDREQRLVVRASAAGDIYVPEAVNLPGRFVQQGEVVATVLRSGPTRWRAAVLSTDAEFLSNPIRSIDLMPRYGVAQAYTARIFAQSPEVTTSLPSFGLTTKGGGRLLTDSTAQSPVSLEPVVNLLLAVDADMGELPNGSRAHLRFVLEPSPLGPRLWRTIEQTFLKYFGA